MNLPKPVLPRHMLCDLLIGILSVFRLADVAGTLLVYAGAASKPPNKEH